MIGIHRNDELTSPYGNSARRGINFPKWFTRTLTLGTPYFTKFRGRPRAGSYSLHALVWDNSAGASSEVWGGFHKHELRAPDLLPASSGLLFLALLPPRPGCVSRC